MGAEQSTLHGDPGYRGPDDIKFYITDIMIERNDGDGSEEGGAEPGTMCIFGLGGEDENGKMFALSKIAPNKWKVDGEIEFPIALDEVACVIQSGSGDDIGFVAIDHPILDKTVSGKGASKQIQCIDTPDSMQVSWNWNVRRILNAGQPEESEGVVDDYSKIVQMANEAAKIGRQAQATGSLDQLSEAIKKQEEMLRFVAKEDPNLPTMLSNLGSFLLLRFEMTGVRQDLADAMTKHTMAVTLTPREHANRPDYLINLASCFMCEFQLTGDLQDIAVAISCQTKAISLTPEGHANLPSRLTNRGSSFLCRFEHTGDLQDIAEAISSQTKAVHLTPEGHPSLPSCLTNVANSFARRFEYTGDLQDIAEAISSHLNAVTLTPEGHVNLPARLNNLGNSFMARFERTGDLKDIAEAISNHTKAVTLTPDNHADLPSRLINLGNSFACRFEHSGDFQDIVEAISMQSKAVTLLPDGHIDLSGYLNNLGSLHFFQYESSQQEQHLNSSIHYLQIAAKSVGGNRRTKLMAASKWARLLDQHKSNHPDVISAFDIAVSHFALASGLEQTVQHRHTIIQESTGLVLQAAAAALRFEQPEKALEWLEQGRCLVWNQQSNLRTPLDNLHTHDAALAQQFSTVSKQLEHAGSSPRQRSDNMAIEESMELDSQAQKHLQLAQEWEFILKTVQAIPGFESFLQRIQSSVIMESLPTTGPVVIINIHTSRCDAIALLNGLQEPLHIPLPLFSLNKATKLQGAFKTHLQAEGLRQRSGGVEDVGLDDRGEIRALRPPGYRPPLASMGVKDVLEDLWECVVKPILNGLAIPKRDTSPSHQLPRLWWCPTGPLSFLPLHAAGVYRGSDAESVMDYIVSSYTPTVTALTQRVKGAPLAEGKATGLFLTCQPKAPGASFIAGTEREVRSIHDKATKHGINTMKLEGNAVNVEECLGFMEKFSSIHFACHASQNAAEPLKSRFLFHNGRVYLEEIMQRNLKNADLAFLSACETSAGEEKLSDEAVHLAAGMLAAGYKRVVATMWRIGDAYAPHVADDFYQYLWDNREESSGPHFDGFLSAYALHHATQQLRKRLGNSGFSLFAWAPFVHFGY